jgi:rubrerythrin
MTGHSRDNDPFPDPGHDPARRLLLGASGLVLLGGCQNMRDMFDNPTPSAPANAAVSAQAGPPGATTTSLPPTPADIERRKDVDLLNTALALEYEAIAAYQLAIESRMLQAPVQAAFAGFQNDHRQHADAISRAVTRLNGRPVEPKALTAYPFKMERLQRQSDALRFAAELERAAASAYLGAVSAFADRNLSKVAASILGVESMHWAILNSAIGSPPVPEPFIKS